MLTVRPKITELQLQLFARAVHPELFEVCASRTIERDAYRLNLDITTDGHAIRFQTPGQNVLLTEVAAGIHHPLPTQQVLWNQVIDGTVRGKVQVTPGVRYQTQTRLEIVNPKLFVSVQQQLSNRMECQGLVHHFGSNGRLKFGAVSYIHVQSFQQHVLVRAMHTFPETSSIVTGETRFSIDPLS